MAQEWNETDKIFASDHAADGQFGYSVDIDEETAVIGANGRGAVYVFQKQYNGVWEQIQILKPADGKSDDQFGSSVSIHGNTIAVGAIWHDVKKGEVSHKDAGAVYIFEKTGNKWQQAQKILANDPFAEDQFGISLDVYGNEVLVGAIWNDVDAEGKKRRNDAGAAYIFEKSGNKWIQKQKLVPDGRKAFDLFGVSVSLHGDKALIGAYRNGFNENDKDYKEFAGTAYYFRKNADGLWEEKQKLAASNRKEGAFFGYSVSVSEDLAVIGAQEQDLDVKNGKDLKGSGAAYVFELENDVWIEKQELTASDRQKEAYFGETVKTDGMRIIVGAWGQKTDAFGENALDTAGAAYIFEKQGANWVEQKKLTARDRRKGDQMGISVAIDGDVAICGAWGHDFNTSGNENSWAGAAFVFGNCKKPDLSYSASSRFITEGEDVVLGASGAEFISWSNGIKNNTSFVPDRTKSYSVVGRNADGCYAEGQIEIVVKPAAIGEVALKPINTDKPVAPTPKSDFRIIQLDNDRSLAASTQEIIQNFSGMTVLSNLKYEGSGEPAANVKVLLLDENGMILKRGVTDANGMARFELLDPDRTYDVVIDKNDPQLDATVMKEGQELTLKQNQFIEDVGGYALLSHIEFKESSEPAPEIYVLLLDENGYVLKKGRTDGKGVARFEELDKSKSYQVIIDKNHPTLNVDVSMNGRLIAVNTEKILQNFEKLTLLSRISYAESEDPAAEVPVMLVDENGMVLKKGMTDENGMAMFVMPDDNKTYRVVIDREMLLGAESEQDDKSFSFDNIYFDFNSDKIRPEAAVILNRLAKVLIEKKDKKIVIRAHTDALGTDDVNKSLAARRGESVRNYLVAKGVSGERIEVIAIGDEQPIASNEIDMGRQLNRRVEFEIMN